MRANAGIAKTTLKKDINLALQTLLIIPSLLIVLGGMYYLVPADKAVAPLVCIWLPQHFAAMWLIYLFDCTCSDPNLKKTLSTNLPHLTQMCPIAPTRSITRRTLSNRRMRRHSWDPLTASCGPLRLFPRTSTSSTIYGLSCPFVSELGHR